jgi:thiol-disulfide isomerase/thioredoxin
MIGRHQFIHGTAALFAAPLCLLGLAPEPTPSARPSPIDKEYRPPHDHPLNFSIRVLDGADFTLHDHHGSIVVVNFFATWCPPCRKETPDLVAFAAAHADDTMVLGINVAESDDTVRAFRKKYGISFPIAMDAHGGYMQGMFTGNMAYPSSVVFDANGYVVAAWRGGYDRAGFEWARSLALGQT